MKALGIGCVLLLAVATGGARAEARSVTVSNFEFTPQQTVAAAGDAITWTWAAGSFSHNVTAEVGDDFASPTQSSGSFSASFGGGTVLYRCTLHSTFTAPSRCEGMCAVLTDDATAPEPPTIETPADGAHPTSRTVTFSGSAPADAEIVRLREGSSVIAETVPSSGTWSATVTLENGDHVVSATAVDLGMNESAAATVRFTLAVDTDPPAATIVVPRNLSVVGRVVTFSGDASDDLSVASVDVSITDLITGTTQTHGATCSGCGARETSWTLARTLDPGIYRAKAVARDGTGKLGTSSETTFVVL